MTVASVYLEIFVVNIEITHQMKPHTFHLSHQNHKENFTYTQALITSQPMIRCNGNCFQRSILIVII
jgi:hypothetical protein